MHWDCWAAMPFWGTMRSATSDHVCGPFLNKGQGFSVYKQTHTEWRWYFAWVSCCNTPDVLLSMFSTSYIFCAASRPLQLCCQRSNGDIVICKHTQYNNPMPAAAVGNIRATAVYGVYNSELGTDVVVDVWSLQCDVYWRLIEHMPPRILC